MVGAGVYKIVQTQNQIQSFHPTDSKFLFFVLFLIFDLVK